MSQESGIVNSREPFVPITLLVLQPLLDALNYKWSNHYVVPSNPQAKWCLVDKNTGQAGRVGMTEEQAKQQLIEEAAARIVDARRVVANIAAGVQNFLEKIEYEKKRMK